MNTPYLIFKEGQVWNMYLGGIWYQSRELLERLGSNQYDVKKSTISKRPGQKAGKRK
jgi:hypothetical protein